MKQTLTLLCLTFLTMNAFSQISFQANTPASVGLSSNRQLFGIIDLNNDDKDDIIIRDSVGKALFYKNTGTASFSSINTGVNINLTNGFISIADFNNDYYQDFVVLYNDSILFYKNNGNSTFSNITSILNITNPSSRNFFLGASKGSWDDYDADGDLDLIFVSKDATNSFIEVFVNNGNTFSRTTLKTFALPITPILVLIDYDNDQDQDFLILSFNNSNPPLSQYSYQNILLYQKAGTSYTDVTSTSGLGLGSNHGFAQIWDYNNDGFADIIMGTTDNVFNGTNVNRVYKNLGTGSFADVSTILNLKNGNDYYRGVHTEDFENDGDIDVLYSVSNHLFLNSNNNAFSNDLISSSSLSTAIYPIFIDIDNNGKLDALDQDLNPYINTSASGNFIKIKLFGCPALKDPRGSRVHVYSNGKAQTRYLVGGSVNFGINSQVSTILTFGIGASNNVDSIKVFWPNGGVSTILSASINRMNHIYQSAVCVSSGSTTCLSTVYDTVHVVMTDTLQVIKHDTVYISSNITSDTLRVNIHTGLSSTSPIINSLKVYPNPASTQLNIELENAGYYTAKLDGVAGQSVITPTSGNIDISGLANGVYVLTIYDGNGKLISTSKVSIIK